MEKESKTTQTRNSRSQAGVGCAAQADATLHGGRRPHGGGITPIRQSGGLRRKDKPGKEPETKNAGRRILRRVYAATVPHDGRQTAAVRKIRPVSRLYRYGAVATFLLLVGVSAVIGFRALERTPAACGVGGLAGSGGIYVARR